MNAYQYKSDLSPSRRRLLEWMQGIGFGRFEGLLVCGGEPVLSPAPRVVRDIKLGGDNGPRPERAHDDFVLKAQHVELFRHLDALGDGSVALLEVKHGLPFLLRVTEGA